MPHRYTSNKPLRSLPPTYPTTSASPYHQTASYIYITGHPSPHPCTWCRHASLIPLLPFPHCILPPHTADPFNEHCANAHYWLGETSLYDEDYDRGDELRRFDQRCSRLLRACVERRRTRAAEETEEERGLGRGLTRVRLALVGERGGDGAWCGKGRWFQLGG